MQTRIVSTGDGRISLQVELDIGACRTLAECEMVIQEAIDEAGTLATAEVLKRFDTDGRPIERDGLKLTSKGRVPKRYETPYGVADVERHVYQPSRGGATYCPLDDRAGIVLSATPRFARMIASKFAEFGSARVQEDMAENHGRRFSRGLVAHLAEAVAALAEFQDEQTIYRLPEFEEPTVTLVVALDEVGISSRPDPAKVVLGSIGFYNADNRRQYTLYLADLFESGRPPHPHESYPGRFLKRMNRELKRAVKTQAHGGRVIGVTGEHPWSVEFLRGYTTIQFIDPETVTGILSRAAQAYFDQSLPTDGREEDPQEQIWRRRQKKDWLHEAGEQLRSDGGVQHVVNLLEAWLRDPLPGEERATISGALGIIARENGAGRMNYRDPAAWFVFANGGILSGLANAVLGDRLNHPKFKIGLSAAKAILILRELTRTPDRWEEFWSRTTRKDGSDARPYI